MQPGFLVRRAEFAEPKPYDGRSEIQFAVLGSCLWFAAIAIRLGFSNRGWTLPERLVEAASFVVFAAIPAFFLATPPGERLARTVLLKKAGIWFQTGTCLLLGIYISAVKFLGLDSSRFRWLTRLDDLILENQFWLNTLLFLIGVFIVLRIPFLFLKFRDRAFRFERFQDWIKTLWHNPELLILLLLNFVYISLANTSLVSPRFESESSGYWMGFSYFLTFFLMNLPIAKGTSSDRFMVFDLLLSATCLYSLSWFAGPNFSFGVFIGLTLFILVVIYGTGLGREHFGYSFQTNRREVVYTVKLILLAFVTLVPIAFLLGFTSGTQGSGLNFDSLLNRFLFLFSYGLLFSFRVGVFEEILFRSGLMVAIRDQLLERKKSQLNSKKLVWISALICSVIFGICHIGNEPGAGIALSPFEYKTVYMVLATGASMFYSIAFGETNRLWSSIVIHGVVDTTAVLLLGASLVVPF